MSVKKNKNIFLTLFTALVLTAVLVQASEVHSPLQRDHVNLKRLIKKRAPVPQGLSDLLPPVAGAAPNPNLPPDPSDSLSLSSSSSSASSAGASSTSSASTSASSAASSASSAQSSSASGSSTSAAPSSEALNLTNAPVAATKTGAIVTQTENVDVPAPSTPALQGDLNNNNKPQGTITLAVIIGIAASVGGIVILWTIFRKWKLGRSDKFDKRLQPADWQPTQRPSSDDVVPAHRRMNSGGSFNSSVGNRLGPLPDHDFTAGSTSIGGYADMTRGPGPQMQESRYGGHGGYGY